MSEDSSATQLEHLMALAVSLHAGRADLQPRLLPGRIPEDCPLHIPVPPHSRLLGTLAQAGRHYVIMLQCDLPLKEALGLYRTQLAALDWTGRVSSYQQPAGESVQSDLRPSVTLNLHHPPSWALLILTEREDATTLVHLDVMRGEQSAPQAQPE